MKIMQVMAGASNGGAEAAFEDLCLAIHERGVDQKLVLRPNNPERINRLKSAGMDVETLPFGGALDIFTPWKMKKIITQYNPQIVQTWMSRAAAKTPSAASPKNYIKVSRFGGYYDLKYYKTTDYYVTNTKDIQNYLWDQGVDKNLVRHINNFAYVQPITIPVARNTLNTPSDAFVILSLARYHAVKALDVLISAAARIENCHVWLAGQGPLESDLKKQAMELGVSGRIHFLGWRSDRAELLKSADVCVLPSRFEPFGTTFVQAWAQKTPLICSNAQGPSQYIRPNEDALMFDIDDIDGLEKSLNLIKNDPELGKKLAIAGYNRFINEFSKDKTVDAYLAYFDEIIKKENGSSAQSA